MPLTRSSKNSNITQKTSISSSKMDVKSSSSSTQSASSTLMGLKRKADGRTVLGDATNKTQSSILAGGVRRALATKRANQKQQHQHNSNQSSSNSKVQLTPKISLPRPPAPFTGHDNLTIVPLDLWRIELRQELLAKGKFYDQEKVNKDNHIESPDFSLGIFEYMKWREERFDIKAYFSQDSATATFKQSGFTEQDRRTLVDWMVEFQEIQETTHETLYLAVRLCDYYFSQRQVPRERLQLFAFVGYLLASKFEERWPPTFEDMIYLSEDAYTRDDFINAELDMLKVLEFDINVPISYRYLRRYAKCIGMDMRSLTVARFYLELTLQEYQYITEKQSSLAAAALWIALSTLGYDITNRKKATSVRYDKKYWTDLLSYYTGYREWEIIGLAKRMAATARDIQIECAGSSGNAEFDDNDRVPKIVYNKYVSPTFFSVASLRIPTNSEIELHERRLTSERIDYEATLEPCVKRQSLGSAVRANTSQLRKMTLRSSTTPDQLPPPLDADKRRRRTPSDNNKPTAPEEDKEN